MRYVLEGEWTGYTSAQRKIVHREVVTDKRRIERLKKLTCIVYTDGTSLLLSLREAKPREQVVAMNSYGSLIRDAEKMQGSRVRVADMPENA
jgi:hypothetical protein